MAFIYFVMHKMAINNVIKKTLEILIVPMGLAAVLVPYSLIIGWGSISLIIFWFVIIPITASILPFLISKNKNHLLESLVGLVIFYGLMVFMIYSHYQTDYFKIMMVSFFINLFTIVVISLMEWPKMHTQ